MCISPTTRDSTAIYTRLSFLITVTFPFEGVLIFSFLSLTNMMLDYITTIITADSILEINNSIDALRKIPGVVDTNTVIILRKVI